MRDGIKEQFTAALSATGVRLEKSGHDVALFAVASSARVAAVAAANEPGLAQVFKDEQLRVFLFATGRAVRVGDAEDAQAWGLITGLLIGAASA